jgi:HD-like signal output (HDOD) protein
MLILITVLVALAGLAAGLFFARRYRAGLAISLGYGTAPQQAASEEATVAPYTNEVIEAVRSECFKVAFGVQRFDYLILGEHATVLERVNESLQTFTPEQSYFPRRPMLLPKLLQALNDDQSERQALTQMILQDPALAGGVLQRANTSYYRITPQPVESIDRAVALLGTEGLRSLVGNVILQPLFRLPSGYFDQFAPITWDQAQRAGFAAQAIAQRTLSGDPLVAQLLALLSALSRVVLFRFTAEQYRRVPNILPRAEVFIRVMQQHGASLCNVIAAEWDLSELSMTALQEQLQQCAPAAMSRVGRTLYFGELCGALALATVRRRHSAEGALALLQEQGLHGELMTAAWQAAQGVAPIRNPRQ